MRDLARSYLLNDETGQDLIEYTLLLFFILMAGLIIIQHAGTSIGTIWAAGNTTLQTASAQVS